MIRASRRPDLTNKNIVAVKSFDDMLNLEEEMKVPIVAVPSGSETTQFMVIRDDVVYIYTLGKTMIDNSKTLDQIQESFDRHIPLKDKKIKK